MYRMFKSIFFTLILIALFAVRSSSQTINATSCSSTDVQTAINAATEGQTVAIPPCPTGVSWTTGVTISGKGISVVGAGSGRAVAYSWSTLGLATGTASLTIQANNVAGTLPSLTNGQTLRIMELVYPSNYLQGTVTSYDPSTGALTINATSAAGTCGATGPAGGPNSSCQRWVVLSTPGVNETKLINNMGFNNDMFSITIDGSYHTSISGIHFAEGASPGPGRYIDIMTNSGLGPVGGQSVLIDNNMFEGHGNPEWIDAHTNQFVVWNNSFVADEWQSSNACIRIVDVSGNLGPWSWTHLSTMGTADSTGQNNGYFETNDLEGVAISTDYDSGTRGVFRYNFMNESYITTHGADTSGHGMRHIEAYNNVGIHQIYASNHNLEFSLGNGWINLRGGTMAVTSNNWPQITGGYPKNDITWQAQNLERNAGPHACWGLGTTSGANYPAPRQVGMGYVTGKGTAHGVDHTCTGSGTPAGCSGNQVFGPASTDALTYVGDSEPAYIWGNTRTLTFTDGDYPTSGAGSECPNPPSPDSVADYVVSGRDYFSGTAKPGWTAYTYPHPLASGTHSSGAPASPTNLLATVN